MARRSQYSYSKRQRELKKKKKKADKLAKKLGINPDGTPIEEPATDENGTEDDGDTSALESSPADEGSETERS